MNKYIKCGAESMILECKFAENGVGKSEKPQIHLSNAKYF